MKEQIIEVKVEKILVNPEQPRKTFNEAELKQLSNSIKKDGLIQLISVIPAGKFFILVDGERRLRATKLAGIKKIKCVLKSAKEQDKYKMLELALIANIQRENMNSIEEAYALKKLLPRYKGNVTKLAAGIGKHMTYISERLNLLKLALPVQELMREGKIRSTQRNVVQAFLRLPDKKVQVVIGRKAAENQLHGNEIVSLCNRYIGITRARKMMGKPGPKGKKANLKIQDDSGSPAIQAVKEKPSGWDALQQTKSLPPWPLFANMVLATCADCPLNPVANDKTCADCGLVDFTRKITREAAHVK